MTEFYYSANKRGRIRVGLVFQANKEIPVDLTPPFS